MFGTFIVSRMPTVFNHLHIPRTYIVHTPCSPLYIYIRIRILDIPWSLCGRPRLKNALLIFLLVFWLKAKLDYWYMAPCKYTHTHTHIYACICVCVCVFEEIIQISGPASVQVRIHVGVAHLHIRTRAKAAQKFIALSHAVCSPSRIPFRYPSPLLHAHCVWPHSGQVSFICNHFSFYTLHL